MVMEFEFITGLAYLSNHVSSRVQTQYPEIDQKFLASHPHRLVFGNIYNQVDSKIPKHYASAYNLSAATSQAD